MLGVGKFMSTSEIGGVWIVDELDNWDRPIWKFEIRLTGFGTTWAEGWDDMRKVRWTTRERARIMRRGYESQMGHDKDGRPRKDRIKKPGITGMGGIKDSTSWI